eukprot:TRINITY_DN19688_c0_g1_i2.p1 TRINITY_DN19688_c0_g1~~TRINITY_DN19688_c0_g1_i2.p1  ORF type:complete len:449 (+),score=86.76 TRINITY_DN19688_c0_g1_i2:36-1349(+)
MTTDVASPDSSLFPVFVPGDISSISGVSGVTATRRESGSPSNWLRKRHRKSIFDKPYWWRVLRTFLCFTTKIRKISLLVPLSGKELATAQFAYDRCGGMSKLSSISTFLRNLGQQVSDYDLEYLATTHPVAWSTGSVLTWRQATTLLQRIKRSYLKQNLVSDTERAFMALGGNRISGSPIQMELLNKVVTDFDLELEGFADLNYEEFSALLNTPTAADESLGDCGSESSSKAVTPTLIPSIARSGLSPFVSVPRTIQPESDEEIPSAVVLSREPPKKFDFKPQKENELLKQVNSSKRYVRHNGGKWATTEERNVEKLELARRRRIPRPISLKVVEQIDADPQSDSSPHPPLTSRTEGSTPFKRVSPLGKLKHGTAFSPVLIRHSHSTPTLSLSSKAQTPRHSTPLSAADFGRPKFGYQNLTRKKLQRARDKLRGVRS